MNFQYKYNTEHLYYMQEQIWECKDNINIYSDLSEFEHNQIKDYIPEKPRVIMDLGCGLGRASIYLNHILKDPNILYIMADTTGDTENHGSWNLDEYYNNLNLTKSFCLLNGLENIQIFDTKKDNWFNLPDIDYVMSRCAFGMHFPIEWVLQSDLWQILDSDATLIFGTRNRETYSEKSFIDMFQTVKFIKQDRIWPYPHQDWLILRTPID